MTKETFEKLTDIVAADGFGEVLNSAQSADELAALLKEKGVEVTADELLTYFEGVNYLEHGDEVLSDEDLELVSGGGPVWDWIKGKVEKVVEDIKQDVKKIKKKFEYIFGGGFVEDCARGRIKHPWIK